MGTTAKTAVYGVIGDPVGHSLSPVIMNTAFAENGIDAVYAAFPVPEGELATALNGCRALGIAGLNVTYPHKVAAASAANERSRRVELLDAANTLLFSAGARSGEDEGAAWIAAHNTDAPGTALAIEAFGGQSCRGKRVAIFGAGGAARAAALGLLEAGAGYVAFLARDPMKAEALTAKLREAFADRVFSFAELGEAHVRACADEVGNAQIVIQATPVGMGSQAADDPLGRLLQESNLLRRGQVCLEMVYQPRITPFLRQAAGEGAVALDGLTLLVSQAAESFTRWTGKTFDPEQMYAHLARGDDAGKPVS